MVCLVTFKLHLSFQVVVMLTLFEFELKLFFQLLGVLTENYEFANMKAERKFNKTIMNLYAFLFWDAYSFFYFKRRQKFKYLYCASVGLILLSTFVFLMNKQYKSPEWKKWMKKRWFFDENLQLWCRFCSGFQAVDFKAG